jgi:adenosine deaminase
MEHNFLPGNGLWREPDNFRQLASPCAKDSAGSDKPTTSCASFLEVNEKARQQWELEKRFRVFEDAH